VASRARYELFGLMLVAVVTLDYIRTFVLFILREKWFEIRAPLNKRR
jgi:hypothetical protein